MFFFVEKYRSASKICRYFVIVNRSIEICYMEQSYLLLGSNLGARRYYLQIAQYLLGTRVGCITGCSSFYETAAWGLEDQHPFLNQVLEIETPLSPIQLLTTCLAIEQEIGRVRHEKWGARVIDIDLLFYGDQVVDTALLQVPHPRIQERRFTLVPLVELCPNKQHPLLHKNIRLLLAECPDKLWVSKVSG